MRTRKYSGAQNAYIERFNQTSRADAFDGYVFTACAEHARNNVKHQTHMLPCMS